MKKIVLFLMILSVNVHGQTQPDIKNKNWFLTKLEISNQVYNRPANPEADTKNINFYITEITQFNTYIQAWVSFCYGYDMGEVDLDEQSQILYCETFGTIAFPQDCNLQVNNDFDDLHASFWVEIDNNRDTHLNPYRYDYEIIEVNNGLELIITNESGDKAYYNDVTASTDIFKKLPVKIYPNPVKSVLNIELPAADYQNVLIDMYDVTGKKIKSFKESWQENINLNMESLPTGNYLLELKIPDEPGRGHFVKIIKE